jgi:hypothetical protein
MPEYHSRRIVLKVPEVEFYAEVSVVEIVHGYVPCDEGNSADGITKNRKDPVRRRRGLFW